MQQKIRILSVVGLFVILLTVGFFYLPATFADVVYPLKYVDEIRECAAPYDVEPAIIAAIIKQESGFNPQAVSRAGAMGLGQIMPATWRGINDKEWHLDNADPFDPKTNICFTATHIAGLLGRYNGDVVAAFAAYNGGAAVGDRIMASRGAAIPAETSGYIVSVPSLLESYRMIYGSDLSRAYGSPFVEKPSPKTFWQRIVADGIERFLK